MKNKLIYALVIIPGFIMSSCSGGSNESETTVTPSVDTSSAAVKDNTNTVVTDTGRMPGAKDTLPLKIVQGKNGKKGKIVIVLPKVDGGKAMDADKEGYYSNVEVWPAYPGGQKALEDFFANNVEYPQEAADNGTEGQVNISFLVDESGKVSSPTILGKKIGDGLEEEAMRVFNKMPTWSPGKIKGKNVKTRFTLPVRFQLES